MPSRIASGVFIVAIADVSLMPQTSHGGRPIAAKNSSTSSGVGAAPTTLHCTFSRPSAARSGANSCSSACATPARQLVRHRLAGLLEAHLLDAASIAPSIFALTSGSSWPATIASRPAFSFSQIRGTAPKNVGCTWPTICMTASGRRTS